jgi:hypothetical protein
VADLLIVDGSNAVAARASSRIERRIWSVKKRIASRGRFSPMVPIQHPLIAGEGLKNRWLDVHMRASERTAASAAPHD